MSTPTTPAGEAKLQFEFATATRIIFGSGSIRDLPKLATAWGRRVLLVTGRSPARAQSAVDKLTQAGAAVATFAITGEPTVQAVTEGVARARDHQADVVVAVGGGSAIDGGKAIAGLATNSGDIFDYLEVIGKARPLALPALPFITVPTTAGSGAEVTRNAVIASPENRVKASLRSSFLLPRVACVDPELTYNLPPDVTATTGLDALTQLIEPYVSIRANPLTDGFCIEGLRRVARSLRTAFDHARRRAAEPNNETSEHRAAREDMALASLFGGLSLANAGLGAVHGFAAPIGGAFPAPHGAVCAALLPHVIEINLRALRQRQPHSPALARYREIGRLLTGMAEAEAEDGLAWIRELWLELGIASLRTYGIGRADFETLGTNASKASSMKANPVELTPDELIEILERAW